MNWNLFVVVGFVIVVFLFVVGVVSYDPGAECEVLRANYVH